MTLYFAPQAEADFAAIIGYLAERNAIAATELSDRIFTVIDKLARAESLRVRNKRWSPARWCGAGRSLP